MLVDDKLAKEKLALVITEAASSYMKSIITDFAQLIRNTDLTDCQQQKEQKAMNEHSSGTRAEVPPSATPSGTPLLDAAGVFYPPEDEEGSHTLNMNDTFGWALAWGEPVPDDKLKEVTELYARYGNHGLNYWVSEQHDKVRSEFEDINRGIDFVRQEELVRRSTPSSTKRAYLKHSYTLGGPLPEALGKADTVARQNKQDGVADQGSVRNATDELALLKKAIKKVSRRYPSLTADCSPYDGISIEDAIYAAIRALPVLEDKPATGMEWETNDG